MICGYLFIFLMLFYCQRCASQLQVDSRELDRRKTLQVMSVAKPVGDNDEFEKQRTAAIAEVAKSKEVRMKAFGMGSFGFLFFCFCM